MSRLADRQHRLAQHRLADTVGRALGGVLLALDELDSQAAMDAYNRQAVRIVGGGQRQAATFAISYMAAVVPPATTALPASPTRAVEGLLVTGESPVARSPMLKVWGELKQGVAAPLARELGASYASSLSSGDLLAAERGGLAEGARAADDTIVGWRKDPAPGACGWCLTLADVEYNDPDEVPFHDNDRCGVVPVMLGDVRVPEPDIYADIPF